jgi:hypothetical protein
LSVDDAGFLSVDDAGFLSVDDASFLSVDDAEFLSVEALRSFDPPAVATGFFGSDFAGETGGFDASTTGFFSSTFLIESDLLTGRLITGFYSIFGLFLSSIFRALV